MLFAVIDLHNKLSTRGVNIFNIDLDLYKFIPPNKALQLLSATPKCIMVAALLLSTLLVISIPGAVSFAPPSTTLAGSVDDRRIARTNLASSRRSHAPSHLQASLEAILFDCDGVLADTERDGHR